MDTVRQLRRSSGQCAEAGDGGPDMAARLIAEIRARREALALSVEEVAECCGIDRRLLHDWERGIGSPGLDEVASWTAALGLNLTLTVGVDGARRGVRVDWERRCIAVDGAPVRLTPMEWKALERLARSPGELVTHEALFEHLYGADEPYRAQSTAIRVLITKLRRLLPLRIEARWGRGYIVSGIEGPTPAAPDDGGGTGGRERPRPEAARRDVTPAAKPGRGETAPASRDHSDPGRASASRHAAAAVRVSPCRAEELGVIERFLAERGVTRCPDVGTIQHSPLPTLVWDKMKRKWVRPQVEREVG